MMRLTILGDGTLATGIRKCCEHIFNLQAEISTTDVLWVCYDTPILPNGLPDDDYIMAQIIPIMALVPPAALVVVSSQVPSGTIRRMERRFTYNDFAYSPENIRAKYAEQDFRHQERIIVGTRKWDERLDKLFSPFTTNIVKVSVESAEMIKHALNGFLALSVAYANELNEVCRLTGANMEEVTNGLRSDPRIGLRAYLRAGEPYGDHLTREVFNLNELTRVEPLPLLTAIRESNERQEKKVNTTKFWASRGWKS